MLLLLINSWPLSSSLSLQLPYITFLENLLFFIIPLTLISRGWEQQNSFLSIVISEPLFFYLCIKVPAPLNLMLHYLLATSPSTSLYLCHLWASQSHRPCPHLLMHITYISSTPVALKVHPRPVATSNTGELARRAHSWASPQTY